MLGFLDLADYFQWMTPANLILIAAFLSSLATNVFQFRNSRAEVIHKTDMKTISSLEKSLERAETDRDVFEKSVGVEKARADAALSELASVKRELVSLMAIDIHELLEYAAMKRRKEALERECESLNEELAHGGRPRGPRQLGGGGKGGGE